MKSEKYENFSVTELTYTYPYCTVTIYPQTHEPHSLKSTHFIHGRDPTGHGLCTAGKALATGGYQERYNLPTHTSVWIPLIRVRLESLLANPSLCVWLLLVKYLVFICLPLLLWQLAPADQEMVGPVLSSLTYRGQPLLIYEKLFRAWFSPPPFNSFLAFVKF